VKFLNHFIFNICNVWFSFTVVLPSYPAHLALVNSLRLSFVISSHYSLSFIINSSARTVCPLALHRTLCYPSPYSCYSFCCERVPSLTFLSFQLSSFGTSARMDMHESFFIFNHFSSAYCFVFSFANVPFNLGALGQSPVYSRAVVFLYLYC